MSPGHRIQLSSAARLSTAQNRHGLQPLHDHENPSKTGKNRGIFIMNADLIEKYIDISLSQGIPLVPPRASKSILSSLNSIQCGKPYVIHIPYENCQEGLRDLCNDCVIRKNQGKSFFVNKKRSSSFSSSSSSSSSKLSDPDPDPDHLKKFDLVGVES